MGGGRVLAWVFGAGPLGALALAWLALSPDLMLATLVFLATAAGLGLGNGAIFKMVAEYFPKNTGLVTGVVGCAGGLGGFFPPLLMGVVKGATGTYILAFVLLALFSSACLVILLRLPRSRAAVGTAA
jgi:NNP family nitrate/nitrite transporter-like MFS transporter